MHDLAILGAGAAGMLGALCAADRGLTVALIDPHWDLPSNLAISGGLSNGWGASEVGWSGASKIGWFDTRHSFL